MKRTCNDCRALDGHSSNSSYSCELGFKVEHNDMHGKFNVRKIPKPLEECPKPKTINQLFEAEKEYSKRRRVDQ